MTCEVAVMNKRGIALAADSAVTLGNGKKIYHTAEKLLSLSPSIPVAIMTFGAADMMNVPWETVVKIYAQKLGNRTFDTLDQYAKDFLSFIEGATSLFPPEDQKHRVKGVVEAAWSELYRDKLSEKLGENSKVPETDKLGNLAEIIHSDHELWMKYDDIEGLGTDYGARSREGIRGRAGSSRKTSLRGNETTPRPEIGSAQDSELHVREGMVSLGGRKRGRDRRNGRDRAVSGAASIPGWHNRGWQAALCEG